MKILINCDSVSCFEKWFPWNAFLHVSGCTHITKYIFYVDFDLIINQTNKLWNVHACNLIFSFGLGSKWLTGSSSISGTAGPGFCDSNAHPSRLALFCLGLSNIHQAITEIMTLKVPDIIKTLSIRICRSANSISENI